MLNKLDVIKAFNLELYPFEVQISFIDLCF